MRILVLNGSPHPDGATADMVAAFEKGAKEAGHDVVTFSVARMNVKITQYYQSIVEYWGVKNAGIFTANGDKNKSEEKRQELYTFGKNLKGEIA
jgi:putative NADPH-quinone reductase